MPDNTTPVVNPGDNSPWQPPLIINDPAVKMETIIIPETGMYPIEITINGFKRTLYARPGDEVEVPESVAAVLKNVKRPAPAEDGWKDAWATLRDCGESGGSEPTYETVAEIQVGDPVEVEDEKPDWIPEGCSVYMVTDTAAAKAIMASAGDNLFFNSVETPLTRFGGETVIFGYNAEMGEETPVVTGQPAYIVAAVNAGETDAIVELLSTEDLSGQTVKILKKVEEQGGGGKIPKNVKPTYEFGFSVEIDPQDEEEFIVTPATGSTYEAITAAMAETPLVYAYVDFSVGIKIRMPFAATNENTGTESVFAECLVWSGTRFMCAQLKVSANGEFEFIAHET